MQRPPHWTSRPRCKGRLISIQIGFSQPKSESFAPKIFWKMRGLPQVMAESESNALTLLRTSLGESVGAIRISPKGWFRHADSPSVRRNRKTEPTLFMSTNIAESLRISLHNLVSERGQSDANAAILETTLIRNGAFCGRRFSCAGFSLVWFQEEEQVKLYNPEGALEQSCSVSQFCNHTSQAIARNIRRAA
jgi:hypothetical protein